MGNLSKSLKRNWINFPMSGACSKETAIAFLASTQTNVLKEALSQRWHTQLLGFVMGHGRMPNLDEQKICRDNTAAFEMNFLNMIKSETPNQKSLDQIKSIQASSDLLKETFEDMLDHMESERARENRALDGQTYPEIENGSQRALK